MFFFFNFFFGEHASLDLLVWHAKDFRKKPFSDSIRSRSLAKAVELCGRSPCPCAPSAHFLAASLRLPLSRRQAQITDEETAGLAGVKSTFEFHAPRPAEWGAILFLCLPALTRPGLDLGLSRTDNLAATDNRAHGC